MHHTSFTIALAGNPNCGKTAVFNALTGSQQRVGNWPGVTVDKKVGRYVYHDQAVDVVDLPGVYSLAVTDADSAIDARIACEYLIHGNANCIVNVLDGAHLERHLYLTLQLLEMKIPVILAVNMMDIVRQHGIALDLKKLQKCLGCPVVSLTASRGEGIDQLRDSVAEVIQKPRLSTWSLSLPSSLAQGIHCLKQTIFHQANTEMTKRVDWLMHALLSGDILAQQYAGDALTKASLSVAKTLDEDPDILIADARYEFISTLMTKIITFEKTKRQTVTQILDRIVLHRVFGIPIFLGMMYCMFLFAINIGGAFQDFFDISTTTIFVNGSAHLLTAWHWPAWLIAIFSNGIGKGINTVVTFTPVIGAMFLFLSFLEDSGYMARAAFVMDRCMRALGLPGKSFVPMIVGFGCNVPAVMGARTLSNPRDRVVTVMMMPFMSCGARLAIFSVFASAFFPTGGQNIIFLLYLTGILVAVLTGLLLRKTILKGNPAPLVMELPPYHMPRLMALHRQAWLRLKGFLFRAGRVIVPVCVLIGTLNAVSIRAGVITHYHSGGAHSVLSDIGRVVTPFLKPIGISSDNWPATVGLATGILAKEVVIGTLNTLYSQVGNLTHQEAEQFNLRQGLSAALLSIPENIRGLKNAFKNPIKANAASANMNHAVYGVMEKYFNGKLGAFAYLLFVLLYFPCVATMAVMRRELNTMWALASVLWSTVIAYSLATLVYQVGILL